MYVHVDKKETVYYTFKELQSNPNIFTRMALIFGCSN